MNRTPTKLYFFDRIAESESKYKEQVALILSIRRSVFERISLCDEYTMTRCIDQTQVFSSDRFRPVECLTFIPFHAEIRSRSEELMAN